MNHVMVDIECLGSQPGSVIVSIGAVRFGLPVGIADTDPFYRNISIKSSIKAGCTVDGDNVKWWLTQSKEAQERLFDPAPTGFHEALSAFRQWYGTPKFTWSHGSNFDLTLLDSAYRLLNQMPPWKYKQVRDTRTMFWMAPDYGRFVKERKAMVPVDGVKHDALADAIRQVHWVQSAYRLILGERLDQTPEVEGSD